MRAVLALLALVGCDRETNPLYCETHPTDHTTGCPFLDAAPLPDAAYKDAKYSDAPPNYYRIAGTVNGLTEAGLVLQDNGGDDLPRTADGAFIFAMALPNGAAYAVTVSMQPGTQTCTVANGTGIVQGADVTNVTVTCSSPGIGCGSDGTTYCTVGSQDCCTASLSCKSLSSSCNGGVKIECDKTSDCSGGDVCCASTGMGNSLTSVQCQQGFQCGGPGHYVLCDPNAAMPCFGTQTCQPVTNQPILAQLGYHFCQ